MNDKNLHKLIRGLSDIEISLPQQQRALRARLLDQHARQQTFIRHPLSTFKITITRGAPLLMKKNVLIISFSALAVSIFAVGLLLLGGGDTSSVSAAQLVEDATRKTQQMNPAEIAQLNDQWRLDVTQRLNEAKQAKTLRIISPEELNSWGGSVAKTNGPVETYVTYADDNGHRIVIGLTGSNEPLFLYDFDGIQNNAGASAPGAETKEKETGANKKQ